MKIFNSFRNSSLIILVSISFLIFSCSQYEINNQKFDYSIYDAYKLADIQLSSNNASSRNSLQDMKDLLNQLNYQYSTNIQIPDNILNGMLTETSVPEIKVFVKNEGLLNTLDVELISDFIADFETNSFRNSIKSFENAVIAEICHSKSLIN